MFLRADLTTNKKKSKKSHKDKSVDGEGKHTSKKDRRREDKNDGKPYAGSGGMKKLLARRRREEETHQQQEKSDREEEDQQQQEMEEDMALPESGDAADQVDDTAEKLKQDESMVTLDEAVAAAAAPVPKPAPLASTSTPLNMDSARMPSSGRVGRTRHNPIGTNRPQRRGGRFSAVEEETEEDLAAEDEKRQLEEAAKKIPSFAALENFSFAQGVS
jgi:nucleoporin NUP1